jgi:Tol biopolymer transport system component
MLVSVFVLVAAILAWSRWGPEVNPDSEAALRRQIASNAPQLVLYDRGGQLLGAVGVAADYSNPALSPDGRRVAVSVRDSTRNRDIWIYDLINGGRTQFTSHPADETNPVWSPDGSEIVYCSDRLGRRDLYSRRSPDAPERLVLATARNKNPLDWAGDGSGIYYNNELPEGGHEIWMLPLGRESSPRPFLSSSETTLDWLAVSPDVRWVLYRTGRLPNSHILLRPLDLNSPEWLVGGDGILEGHWRGDSREIYYISGNQMMAQDIEVSGKQLRLGRLTPLFRVPRPNSFGRNAFVVSPDGRRFLIRTGR